MRGAIDGQGCILDDGGTIPSMEYRAQLTRVVHGQEVAEPEFDGEQAVIQISDGQLDARGPNGEVLVLTAPPDELFAPQAILPTESEVAANRRDIIVPGVEPEGNQVDWHLFFDLRATDIERFVAALEASGWRVDRPPPG